MIDAPTSGIIAATNVVTIQKTTFPGPENEERNAEQDRLCPGDDDRSNQRVVQQQIRFFE